MTITATYIEQRIADLNTQYFQGCLPPIPVRLSSAKTFLGKLQYRRQRVGFRWTYTDYCLRINTRLEMTNEEIDDILLHELIHYYIAYKGIHDTSTHGYQFRNIMDYLNRTYSRHISVSQRLTSAQRQQTAGAKIKWHWVGWIELQDGRYCIKLIPCKASSLQRMQQLLPVHFAIASMTWYSTQDPFFNQYPTSNALRMCIVKKEDVLPHLQDALQL